MRTTGQLIAAMIVCLTAGAVGVMAQTMEFTYQGSLMLSEALATGNYDFEFALYDSPAGGAQIGSTLQRPAVAVNNGGFTVKLDFGAEAFPGADRFLEIRIRLSGNPNPHTVLTRDSVSPQRPTPSALYRRQPQIWLRQRRAATTTFKTAVPRNPAAVSTSPVTAQ